MVIPVIYTVLFESIARPLGWSGPDVPNCSVHWLVPSESYIAKNASSPPALVPSKLPAVNPVIYTLLTESIATSQAWSFADVPNCLVHTNVPKESYFAKNASSDPAFEPLKAPLVVPVIYTLLFESIATPRAMSEADVPNCFVHTNVPVEESYFAKNASFDPAFEPSKAPVVRPLTYTLLLESIATS